MSRRAFESDTWATLELMPYALRYRLDRAGVKLSLAAWQTLSRDERLALCEHPVTTLADRDSLRVRCFALAARGTHPARPLDPAPDPPPWRGPAAFALARDRLAALGHPLPRDRWEALDDEAAYVLWRLADHAKDDGRLLAAARELGLP